MNRPTVKTPASLMSVTVTDGAAGGSAHPMPNSNIRFVPSERPGNAFNFVRATRRLAVCCRAC